MKIYLEVKGNFGKFNNIVEKTYPVIIKTEKRTKLDFDFIKVLVQDEFSRMRKWYAGWYDFKRITNITFVQNSAFMELYDSYWERKNIININLDDMIGVSELEDKAKLNDIRQLNSQIDKLKDEIDKLKFADEVLEDTFNSKLNNMDKRFDKINDHIDNTQKNQTTFQYKCIASNKKSDLDEFNKQCPVKFEGNKLYGIIMGQPYKCFDGTKTLYTLEVSTNEINKENMVECYELDCTGYARNTIRHVMPISYFFEDVSDIDTDNPTGQKYRFELVNDFKQDYYKDNVKWYPHKGGKKE